MSKYITSNGRPVSFRFGQTVIRVGKKPVEIAPEYAEKILDQYPGWLKCIDPVEEETTSDPAETSVAEADQTAATSETETNQDEIQTEADDTAATSETETEQPEVTQAATPAPIPAETPVPAAKGKSKKKAASKMPVA